MVTPFIVIIKWKTLDVCLVLITITKWLDSEFYLVIITIMVPALEDFSRWPCCSYDFCALVYFVTIMSDITYIFADKQPALFHF